MSAPVKTSKRSPLKFPLAKSAPAKMTTKYSPAKPAKKVKKSKKGSKKGKKKSKKGKAKHGKKNGSNDTLTLALASIAGLGALLLLA